MTLATLPTEVFTIITDYLPTFGDLANLVLTSRRCYEIANDILYRCEHRRNTAGTSHPTVIHWAAYHGRLGTLKRALACGGDVNRAGRHFTYDGLWQARFCLEPLHLREDVAEGAESGDGDDASDDYGLSAYDYDHLAARHNHPEDYAYMDLNYYYLQRQETGSWTPLHMAARAKENPIEIINILVDHGAKIDALSIHACQCHRAGAPKRPYQPPLAELRPTPLHVAICCNNGDAAMRLITLGASPDVDGPPCTERGPMGQLTALHRAALAGNLSLCKFILQSGFQSDVDVETSFSQTPFAMSLYSGKWLPICDWLLSQGAKVDPKTRTTGSPLLLACWRNHPGIVSRLLQHGADPNSRLDDPDDWEGNVFTPGFCAGLTPLMAASFNSSNRAMEALIKAGADVNAVGMWDVVDQEDRTPLCFLFLFHDAGLGSRLSYEALRTLMDAGANPSECGATALQDLCASCVGDELQICVLNELFSTSPGFANLLEGIDPWQAVWRQRAPLERHMGVPKYREWSPMGELGNGRRGKGYDLFCYLLKNGAKIPKSTYLTAVSDAAIEYFDQGGWLEVLLTIDFEKQGLSSPAGSFIEELVGKLIDKPMTMSSKVARSRPAFAC